MSEIDFTSREFPPVRFQVEPTSPTEEGEIDIDSARNQLGIVGDHPAMKGVLEVGARLTPSQPRILIF